MKTLKRVKAVEFERAQRLGTVRTTTSMDSGFAEIHYCVEDDLILVREKSGGRDQHFCVKASAAKQWVFEDSVMDEYFPKKPLPKPKNPEPVEKMEMEKPKTPIEPERKPIRTGSIKRN